MKPPESAYCSRMRRPARVISNSSRIRGASLTVAGMVCCDEGSETGPGRGIGLEAGFAAVASVDQVHGFALARGRKELPVAGGGEALAPEPAVSSWYVPFLCCPVVSAGGALSVRGPSIAHSTAAFPLSVRSSPLPESIPGERNTMLGTRFSGTEDSNGDWVSRRRL